MVMSPSRPQGDNTLVVNPNFDQQVMLVAGIQQHTSVLRGSFERLIVHIECLELCIVAMPLDVEAVEEGHVLNCTMNHSVNITVGVGIDAPTC